MADEADQRFGTGLESLDEVLLGLRAGDNVVWQGESKEDYLHFAEAFRRRAAADGNKFIHFRFSETDPLDFSGPDVKTVDLNPGEGFEEFLVKMLDVVERSGPNARYVFDCISGLATDWYSDRMLGNFFMLVCPYIFERESVAYFWLDENRHTPLAVEVIHETAQVVLDILRCEGTRYLLPIKVINRHTPTMYMLHSCDNDVYEPITKSALVADILSVVPQPWIDFNIDRRDTWSHSLIEAQRLHEQVMIGERVPKHVDALKKRLIRMIVTRDETLAKLCEKYFDIANIICIGKRMIGTGLIGGKSVGMLLARIILKKEDEKWIKRMETHDSFYVGSDVFLTYIIKNDCWWDRLALERDEPEFANAEVLREKIVEGDFPEDIIEELKEMLNYFGQSPIIARSSSLLEDAYGNAFSGKYKSVFSTNFIDPDNFRINVLQCRPFQISREVKKITEGPGEVEPRDVIIESRGPIIGQSAFKPIHRIIYVVPEEYGEMTMSRRHSVARLVGELTNKKQKGHKIMLIGPGRWGTTMPALGIPVSFAEIKYASVLCEIVAMHEGLTPDISLGTHFFNDLVEVNIVYMALFPDKENHVLNKDYLMGAENLLPELIPESKNWADAIRVIDTTNLNGRGVIHVDAVKQHGILYSAS